MSFLRGMWIAAVLAGCLPDSRPSSVQSQSNPSAIEASMHIQAGDILLVPLNCYVCNAIENETDARYSHAVVVANSTHDAGERFVYEAWGQVTKTPYTDILKRKQKNQELFLLRPSEFENADPEIEPRLENVFENSYRDRPFDDEFLWDNIESPGVEKLYCTEFVMKFLNELLENDLTPQPMSFSKNIDFWRQYYAQFKMEPPFNQPGASPATLLFDARLRKLGEVKENQSR